MPARDWESGSTWTDQAKLFRCSLVVSTGVSFHNQHNHKSGSSGSSGSERRHKYLLLLVLLSWTFS